MAPAALLLLLLPSAQALPLDDRAGFAGNTKIMVDGVGVRDETTGLIVIGSVTVDTAAPRNSNVDLCAGFDSGAQRDVFLDDSGGYVLYFTALGPSGGLEGPDEGSTGPYLPGVRILGTSTPRETPGVLPGGAGTPRAPLLSWGTWEVGASSNC